MKTSLEQLEIWIEKFYRINGTPTLDEIKGQIELLKDYEREQLHIANVVGRSEQLIDFCDWYKRTDFNCEGHSSNDCVDEYLKSN